MIVLHQVMSLRTYLTIFLIMKLCDAIFENATNISDETLLNNNLKGFTEAKMEMSESDREIIHNNLSSTYSLVNGLTNAIQWTLGKGKSDVTFNTEEEGSHVEDTTEIFNFTSCSEMVDASLDEMENYTINNLTKESLVITFQYINITYNFEFGIIENISEYLYCMGIGNYYVTAYAHSGVDNISLSIGFNTSLPTALLKFYADCWDWDTNRDLSCIYAVYLLSDFLDLPILSYSPNQDNFWDFSSNVFHLSYNWLKTIRMRNVYMDWGQLKHLNYTSIEELSITNNFVIYLLPDVPTLPRLKCLDMSGSQLVFLPSDQFDNAPILEKLVLSESAISEDPSHIFDNNLSALKILELSNLHPKADFNVANISRLLSLQELDLSRNTITTMTSPFPSLPNLTHLNFSYVMTTTFEMELDLFVNLTSLKILDISGNNIRSLPRDMFRNQKLDQVYMTHNLLYQVDAQLFQQQNIYILDLSYNRFENFPEINSCKLEYLNISYNALSSLINISLDGSFIRHLDVSGNNIVSWNISNVFLDHSSNGTNDTNETWVEFVNISYNSIRVISQPMRESFNTLRSVDLTGNPFDCSDCSIPDLQHWLKNDSHHVVKSVDNLVCLSPKSRVGDKVRDFKFFEEKCLIPQSHLLLELGTPLIVIAIVIVTIMSTGYWYRFELSYIGHLLRLRGRKGEDQHDSSLFDAFICYSGRDRGWVMSNLAPALEKGPEKYRLCLHDRDFPLGSRIVDNIVHSIEMSRRTVVILTEEFVSSKWCQWELEMANHRMFENSRNFLILIELERLNRDKIPRHLKWLMDTRTYLVWPKERKDKKAEDTAVSRLKKALGCSIYHSSIDGESSCQSHLSDEE